MARILVVEDEAALARALARGLAEADHTVDVATDGETGLELAQSGRHELIVLDLLLPRLDGLTLCRRLRDQRIAVPVLVLTARDATADVVRGLDAGADDYMCKPFAFAELLARIRALLRPPNSGDSVLRAGDLHLDVGSRRVSRGGRTLALTTKEHQLLEMLLRHKDTVLARRRLADALWHGDSDPDSNALEVHVASLRRKIERSGEPRLVHTVRGFGYVLREPTP